MRHPNLARLCVLCLAGTTLLIAAGCGGGGFGISIVPLADVAVENDTAFLPWTPWLEKDIVEFRMWPTGNLKPLGNQLAGPAITPQTVRDFNNWPEDWYMAEAAVSVNGGLPSMHLFASTYVQAGPTNVFTVH